MNRSIIRGNTIEQKLRSAEAAVKRLQKKPHNMRVNSFITPFPVSTYVETIPPDGVVCRYMFPGDGLITNACIYMKGDTKQGIQLAAEATNDSGMGSGISIETRKNFTKLTLNISILTGDMLSVKLPVEARVSEIWTAFLWLPDISETEVKSFLSRELRQIEESEDEGV